MKSNRSDMQVRFAPMSSEIAPILKIAGTWKDQAGKKDRVPYLLSEASNGMSMLGPVLLGKYKTASVSRHGMYLRRPKMEIEKGGSLG